MLGDFCDGLLITFNSPPPHIQPACLQVSFWARRWYACDAEVLIDGIVAPPTAANMGSDLKDTAAPAKVKPCCE